MVPTIGTLPNEILNRDSKLLNVFKYWDMHYRGQYKYRNLLVIFCNGKTDAVFATLEIRNHYGEIDVFFFLEFSI